MAGSAGPKIAAHVDYSLLNREYIATFEIPERVVAFSEQDIRLAVFEHLTTEIAKQIMANVDITFKPKEDSK